MLRKTLRIGIGHTVSCLLGVAGLLAPGGCQGIGPVEPTLAVLPTLTASPSATTGPAITPPTPTLAPTWTPLSTIPPRPVVTPLPSYTPPPSTATRDGTAEIPIAATSHDLGAITLLLTEAQLNAALARRFDAAPLANYASSPRITLGDGLMTVMMRITPARTPNNATPQTMTLTVTLAIYAGALEVRPTQLEPLHTAVTTRQVKLGEALLQQTLFDVIKQAAGSPRPLTYNYVNIAPEGVALTVVAR